MPTQHIATLLGATCCVRLAVLRCVVTCCGCCWRKLDHFQTWANNTPTCRNTVARRSQHVLPNNVAICCVGLLPWLRTFGRGLRVNFKFWRGYHFYECDPVFQVWPIFTILSHFYECYPFSSCLTHFYHFEPFLRVRPIWVILSHFYNWPIFTIFSHFYEFDLFFQVWPNFIIFSHFHEWDAFLQVWPIFTTLTHFYESTVYPFEPILRVRPIFSKATQPSPDSYEKSWSVLKKPKWTSKRVGICSYLQVRMLSKFCRNTTNQS